MGVRGLGVDIDGLGRLPLCSAVIMASIPIPMPSSHARSIDNAISIPSSRTRVSSASFATSPPLGRSVPRASSSLSRAGARQPYEPRIVRATPATSSDYCPPSLSPGHARRASTTSASYSRAHRVSLGSLPEPPPVFVPTESFPRPAYLDSSIFRDALHTEAASALPRKDAAASPPVRSHASTPSTESDEETGTPPRRTQASSSAAPSSSSFSLPTKWSTQMKSPHLGLSADGRDLTYSRKLSPRCSAPHILMFPQLEAVTRKALPQGLTSPYLQPAVSTTTKWRSEAKTRGGASITPEI